MTYENEKFEGLHLDKECIEEKTFQECTFYQCEFYENQIVNCYFRSCNFVSCTILNSRFQYTVGTDNSFKNCNLIGINWSDLKKGKQVLLPFSTFTECTLKHNSFYHFPLKKQNFAGCDLTGTIFEQCDLTGSSFKGATLEDAIFDNNNLTSCDFREAAGYAISLYNNKLKKAKFTFPDAINLLTASGIIVD